MKATTYGALAALALVGCGGGSADGGGSGVDGGEDARRGDAGGRPDAASGGSGGAPVTDGATERDAARPPVPSEPRTVAIHLAVVESDAFSRPDQHSLFVGTETPERACDLRPVSAACELQECPASVALVDPPSLGRVTVTTRATSIATIPDPDGTYPQAFGTGSLWSAGQSIRFEADGADLPAVDETLLAPAAIDVTEPTRDWVNLPTNGSFDVRWTGGGDSTVIVAIAYTDLSADLDLQLRCFAPASAGAFSFPEALLSMIPTNEGRSLVVASEERRVLPIAAGEELRLIARSSTRSFTAQ